MPNTDSTLDCDVVIVGAGPAGVTLANLLGSHGISVVILDREASVVDEPRAVGIDDEALRTLQSFGMAEPVLDAAVRNAPIRYYDSHGRVLAHVAPTARPFGWPRRNLFFQPNLERTLRTSLERYPSVKLLTSCEAISLDQAGEGVTVEATQGAGTARIRARYAVGADGGRSFVRRTVGIELEGNTAPMKWLVVDVAEDTWDAPYSAVYTSPHRPSMTIPLPGGYRRFEFKVLDGEDADAMVQPSKVEELMRQFYPTGTVPPAVRRRIYLHHSRTARTFQRDRVFLVGDAAHLQPPFFGQGMNSGIRDVTNLGWKLTLVLEGAAAPSLLASYDAERRETARDMVEFATGIGRLYHPRNRVTEAVRNVFFRGAQRVPGGRDYILQMKYKPVPRYRHGFVDPAPTGKSSLVGRAFPQPLIETLDGRRVRLDDVMGDRLVVLGVGPGLAEALTDATLLRLAEAGGVVVQAHVSSTYRRSGQFDPTTRSARLGAAIVDIFDLEGGLRDLHLASPRDDFYLVRPDRYVAAAGTARDADTIVNRMLDLLGRQSRGGSAA